MPSDVWTPQLAVQSHVCKGYAAVCSPFEHEEVNKLRKRSFIPTDLRISISVCV